MKSCPNINLPEYQLLEKNLGKANTYAIFIANGEVLPTLEEAQKIIEIRDEKIKEETNNIVNEIKASENDKIVTTIEDFSKVIKSRVNAILKNKNYDRLNKLLTSDTGLNKWDSLNTLLSDANKAKTDTGDFEKDLNNLLRKARAIGVGIVQMNNMVDLIFEDVKNITLDKTKALENITTLQYHLYALKDFKIFLEEANITFEGSSLTSSKISDVLGKIKAVERYIIQNDTAGIVGAFKPYVSENIENYLKYFKEEKDRLRKLESKASSNENKLNYKKQADALDKFITQWDLTQDKNIIEFLQGLRGDANLANTLLETYSDSTDPIIASFTNWLKDNLQDVKVESLAFEKEYEKELKKPYEKLSRFNPEDVGKQITNESERVDWEGNEYKVVELLNEFSGKENFRGEQKSYQFIEQTYRNETKQLQELIKNGEDVEENKDKLHKLNKEFALWRREFMQQEYNDLYYEKYNLWNDPIGQELKEDVEEIFSQISDLQTPLLFGQELDAITESAIEDLFKQYILLGNVNYLDGSPKPEGSKDLQKALKMQKIRELNRELYEYIPNEPAFEKAKNKHSEYILSTGIEENSPEYEEEMQEWENKNTRIEVDPEFYEVRTALYEELSSLTEDFPDFSKEIIKKYGTFDSNWEIINNLEYGHRDDDNQVIGTEIQEKGTDRIRQAFKNLEMLQAVGRRASGLTKEEYAEYQYLFANKETLNKEQLTRLNELNSKKKDKSVKAKRIQQLFAEIKELQSRVPTEYYIDTFNNLSQKYEVTLDYNGNFKGSDVLKSPEIVKLLKNDDFKEWFDKNHIEVDVWNNDLKQIVQEYKRLPHWNRIIPNNPDYIKVVPGKKYSIRQVKLQYRTGYDPNTKTVELKESVHIDNKGNFLPKPGKFKSAEYEALKNATNETQKALFKALQIHTKYTLKAQENTANRNKLGLDIPRLRKSSTENNIKLLDKMREKPLDIPSLLWNRIVSKWKSSTDYSQGEGVFDYVFADKYGNEHVSVPIKYTGKVDVSDVSLDLFKGIFKYSTSLKLNKKLVEISPIQQALQRILGTPSHQPLELAKKVVGTDKSPKSKTNTRQLAVQNIVRRVFEGEEKKMELGETIERASSIVKGLTVLKSIAFDIPASIANVINAESQNFVNSSNGYISLSDLGKGHSLFFTDYLPAFLKDYKDNHIGEESLQSQIFDIFNFVASETYESKVGEKLSQSKIKDALSLNWLKNHRSWGELFVQSVNALAYLNATKVEQTLPDGSKITIPLYQAYELDTKGEIKLKEGIDEEWSPNGFKTKRLKNQIEYHNRRVHGNYAKGIDKPEADTYTMYSLFVMMKRFFISMALNRFAASKVIRTPKGIKFVPRYNQIGGAEIGYYLETINLVSKEIESKLITGEFDSMTDSEKIDLMKTIKDFSMMALAYFLLYIVFDWDDDDEDKYKKIRENSWFKNQGLYQSARLLTESSTFINPIQWKEFVLSEPFVSKTLADWWDLMRFTLSQEEYSRNTGIYKEGESKAKARLLKVTGIEKVIKSTGEDQTLDWMKMRAR